MTIPAQATETTYVLSGSALGPFNTVWFYEQATDVQVWLDTGGGPALVNPSNYTLVAADPQDLGGAVTLSGALMTGTSWPGNSQITLARATSVDQPSALGEALGFDPSVYEGALDHIDRQVQDLRTGLGHAVSTPVGEGSVMLPALSQRLGGVAVWSADGSALEADTPEPSTVLGYDVSGAFIHLAISTLGSGGSGGSSPPSPPSGGVGGGGTPASDALDVTYEPPLPSPPTRIVASVLSDYVSILDGYTESQRADVRTGLSSVDCTVVLTEILNNIYNAIGDQPSGIYRGGPVIRFPRGQYKSATPPSIHSTAHLKGEGAGLGAAGVSTEWKMASGVSGPTFNRYNTEAGSVLGTPTFGSDGGSMEDIAIVSAGGSGFGAWGAWTNFGCWIRANGVAVRRCKFSNWAGPDLLVYADSAGTSGDIGNANGVEIWGNRFEFGLYHGLVYFGTDVNAGINGLNDFSNKPGCGKIDFSFLGNKGVMNRYEACGSSSSGYVSHGGHDYQCLDETLASTTTPGTNISVWYPISGSGAAAWVSGHTYICVSPFILANVNARATEDTPYIEGGQGLAHVVSPSFIVGGEWSSTLLTRTSPTLESVNGVNGFLGGHTGLGGIAPDNQQWTVLGGNSLDANQADGGEIFRTARADFGGHDYRDFWANTNLGGLGADIVSTWDNAANLIGWVRTGPATAVTFGRSAAQAAMTAFYKGVFLGNCNGGATPTSFGGAAAAPTSGLAAQGDKLILQGASGGAGNATGSYCTHGGTNGSTAVYENCDALL